MAESFKENIPTTEEAGGGSDFRPRIISLLLLVFIISILHYRTDTEFALLHDLYRRLYYIPIGLAAVWFGLRGGLSASLLVTALYVPHVLLDWHHMSREIADQFMEIALYFVVSGFIGHFADRERRFRKRWQDAAERLGQSYQELRRQADQIIEIEGQLRRADRLSAIGQLSASLTHEIRNPLGSIRGAAEILRDDFPPEHPKAEFIDILLRETDRLNQVVENFLGFARPQGGTEGADTVDLGALVAETTNLLAAQAKRTGISFAVDCRQGILVRGVPVQLRQILLNLLLNAIQATPPGKRIRIGCATREGKVKGLEFREVEGTLADLSVEDEGSGIPDVDLPRIFEPFFTTKAEGTGLGLAISLRIAEAHGGTLRAENGSNGGARFTLTLPLAPRVKAETEAGNG
jgi:signal transduction histidine kinase